MAPPPLHIAILDTDNPVPTVLAKRGLYSNIFTSLLQDASSRLSYPTITTTAYDVVSGQYPPTTVLSTLSGIVITGSAASSYDKDPWVQQLDTWISFIYANYPQIKIFGSCFGHQIVCQSLLRDYGVRVERDGSGWEVGVHEIRLAQEFLGVFPESNSEGLPAASSSTLRLQFVHADHVVLTPSHHSPASSSLPSDWVLLGSTPHCHCQGVYQPSRVLTFQGHFEFDRFVNSETIKVFGPIAGWDDTRIDEALEAIDADDDSLRAAEMVVKFFARTAGSNIQRIHKPIKAARASKPRGVQKSTKEKTRRSGRIEAKSRPVLK
ncbi:class I glutamine amidotransferase-like protein [Lophium mytilinum]|uniref:Class I glutamine amidotransferase-like protein n=1 Tax=Lophium mytilinum TaxID=390894 RepID=A0A6A6QTN2_9PEZI|nr:class I glutamine amidotransferase-like protein [Lophium mytilinum]